MSLKSDLKASQQKLEKLYKLAVSGTVIYRGVEILAKEYKGSMVAVTYANRSQAYAKAEELGPGWTVYHFGRPFLVGRVKAIDPISSN